MGGGRDGKDDYVYVGDNGALYLWYNRGTTDDGMTKDTLQFFDFNGDHVCLISAKMPLELYTIANRSRLCSVTTTFGLIQTMAKRPSCMFTLL